MKKITAALVLAAVGPWQAAQAFECFEPSPSYHDETYFELEDPLDIDIDTYRSSALIQSLQGDWSGTLEEVNCFGADSNPRRKVSTAEVKAEFFDNSQDLISFRIEKTYNESKTIQTDRLGLIHEGTMFAFSATDDVLMSSEKQRRGTFRAKPEEEEEEERRWFGLLPGTNSVATIEKHRNNSAKSGSRLVETQSSVTLQDGILTLEIHYFSNGFYVQTLRFVLEPE